MINYRLEISYDGTNFEGFQRQKTSRTIQGELERVIARLNSQVPVNINVSGRTDAKVHALKQVCTFQTTKQLDLEYFLYALNLALPSDIVCHSVKQVEIDFHPRYHAKNKHYRYLINLGKYDVFKYNYVWQLNQQLDLQAMELAATYLLGEHDFRTFSSATNEQNTIRNISQISFELQGELLIIDYYGNGFLRYMVRKITSILIDVGLGKKTGLELKEMLEKKDISAYSKLVPGVGLYLVDVEY